MAIAASAKFVRSYTVLGDEKLTVTDLTFDSAYVTGGEAVAAVDLGLNTIHTAWIGGLQATGAGVNVSSAFFDLANSTVLLFNETPAEVADTADVSTTVVRVVAIGR